MCSGNPVERADDGLRPYSEVGVADAEMLDERTPCGVYWAADA